MSRTAHLHDEISKTGRFSATTHIRQNGESTMPSLCDGRGYALLCCGLWILDGSSNAGRAQHLRRGSSCGEPPKLDG